MDCSTSSTSSVEDIPVKQEDVELEVDEQSRQVPRHHVASAADAARQQMNRNHCDDVSVALLSPGFSRQVLNNSTKRENIRLSLSVRNLQQDLIQSRLNGPATPIQDTQPINKKQRRMPNRLSLAASNTYERRHAGTRTAPLHSSFRQAVHCDSPTALHVPQGAVRKDVLQRRRVSTTASSASYLPPLPHLPPLQHDDNFTPPMTAKRLPPLRPLMHSIPPTPSSASPHHDKTKTGKSTGMDTLSRAASLNLMKEDYLRACAISFDAFHGIN